MSTIEWTVWCETDNKFVNGLLYEHEGIPTSCLEINSHPITTVGAKAPSIAKENNIDLVKIDEGLLSTTGKSNLTHVHVDVDGGVNNVTSVSTSWDYVISAIKVSFDISPDMVGDKIDLFINKELNIGPISANVDIPTTWADQNYTLFQSVIYGEYTYTCIQNTVSNDVPRSSTTGLVNSEYWRKGLRIQLTDVQLGYLNNSFMAYLFDGMNKSYLGEIWYVDKSDNSIYVGNKHTDDTPLSVSYSALSPTYFLTGYQLIGDVRRGSFPLSTANFREFGDEKIGGAHVPEESIVTLEYTNVDGVSGKSFEGEVSILRGS
jgi:hypothetical protein